MAGKLITLTNPARVMSWQVKVCVDFAYYLEENVKGFTQGLLDRVEPFDATAATPASPPPSSTNFNGPGTQSAYSDGSSQPLNRQTFFNTQSGPSETGTTNAPGMTQPRTGKAALIAQRDDRQEPVQFQDSGIRFNELAEQAAGSSQLPMEVPPTYTPH